MAVSNEPDDLHSILRQFRWGLINQYYTEELYKYLILIELTIK